MGIDQSLSCTGYVFTDYNCNVLHEGVLPTNKRSFNEARMDWIGTCIAGLLHQHGSDLLFVAMENLAFGGSGKMDLLAGVYWEIRRRVWCYHDNLEIYSVPIGTWKKFITGNGRAKKPLIREKINRKYNVYFDNENKYDAYGLLRYQIAMWRKKHGST
jgi:Holliday junction resolvasome RuvABC endonuclease subunit